MDAPSQSSIAPALLGQGPMSSYTVQELQRLLEIAHRSSAAIGLHNHEATDNQTRDIGGLETGDETAKKSSRKICVHWYHGGCFKDGSSPEQTCPFLHQLEGSSMKLSWQTAGQHPDEPCGLELCVFKDGPRRRRQAKASNAAPLSEKKVMTGSALPESAEPKKKSRKRKKKSKQLERRDSIIESNCQEGRHGKLSGPDHEENSAKRPPPRHPDQPVKRRRTDLDYDEGETSDEHFIKDKTCVYWYHGFCPKQRDATLGLGPPCDYKHALTEPPTMAQYPTNGLHGGIACGKEWCPVGRDPRKKQKPDPLLSPSHQHHQHLKEDEHSTRPSEPATSPPNTSQPATSTPAARTNPNADSTCFFWYHGNCARSLDPRSKNGCVFRHALTDPPSMVQPPPGYVHRAPCGRDWCPGDARESFAGVAVGDDQESSTPSAAPTLTAPRPKGKSKQRYKNKVSESLEYGDGGDNEKPNWFLSGFD